MSQYSFESQDEADYWLEPPPEEQPPTEQCFCQSYVDNNGELQDCTCGKCTELLIKDK